MTFFAAVVYWRLCVLGFEKNAVFPMGCFCLAACCSFDSVWSGDEDGIYGRMGLAAAGIWGGAYDGDWRDLWIFDSCREFTDVLFPLYLFRMIGAGDIKMAAVLFGAAGLRQGGRIFLCGLAAAGIWSLVLLIRRGIARQRLTYLVFYLYRSALGGSVEPYYLEARMEKRHLFVWHRACFWG